MITRTTGIILGAALVVSACATIENVTRRDGGMTPAVSDIELAEPVSVASWQVTVPRDLEATDAGLLKPGGDIVWEGEPEGDRHLQVGRIFEESVTRSAGLTGAGRPAAVEIEVLRFHAARETGAGALKGGTHSIRFALTARDPETGEVLIPRHDVSADLAALPARKAKEAEAAGMTQKYRITSYLTNVITRELTGRDVAQAAPLVQAGARPPVMAPHTPAVDGDETGEEIGDETASF